MMCIAQRRIYDWLQQPPSDVGTYSAETSSSSSISHLSSRSTKQLIDADIEKDLYDWITSQLPVKASSTAIREKAKEMFRAKGHTTMECSYGWYRRFSSRFNLTNDPHDESDSIILTWMLVCQDQNHPVSISELQEFAQRKLCKMKPGFCASTGWATRFLKRHHLLLNWDDMYTGQLPLQLKNDAEVFLAMMRKDVIPKYSLDKIGNMDEIPLRFSELYTTKDQMQMSPRVKKYSIMNCDATVILTLMGNGNLLPPFVIMKSQYPCYLHQLHSQNYNSVIVHYCENSGPTTVCLEKWKELIWDKNFGNATTLLLLDDYTLHHEFKANHSSGSFGIKIFPPGCSSKLQPLSTSIRRQFLNYMEEYWLDHIKRGNADTEVRLPSTDEIMKWINASYEKLKQQTEFLLHALTTTKLFTTSMSV